MITIKIEHQWFPIRGSFTISRGSRTEAHVVTVNMSDGRVQGRGECTPYPRYGESVESVMAAIADIVPAIKAGAGRLDIQNLMPAGAARNAVDCAFWDLEAKQVGKPVWQLAELAEPVPVETVFTISLGTVDAMRQAAVAASHLPVLKVKLGGPDDLACLRAVRMGAPASVFVLDANEGWDVATYSQLAPILRDLGVAMVEQPLPAAEDTALAGLDRPLPVCADESAHDRSGLPQLMGKYDLINIKLDKTGGLTEALALRQAALEAGFKIMAGCMLGSSLAMAPAFLIAQGAEFVDLDAPLLLAGDRDVRMSYQGAKVLPPSPHLWG